ncbi:hypothetical protein CEXT_519121 [Caerostris extrusa]|uniref:Uncharacterized protein n=1 Tax=Caerostris extrusa TaxID=172846 RepID=A0AAV4RFM8_CAEEX|nr:hypothetical protein CEXT_519121 [Caerostris extrusa]
MHKSKTFAKLAYVFSNSPPNRPYNRALPHKAQRIHQARPRKAKSSFFRVEQLLPNTMAKFEATGHRRGSGQLSKPQTPLHPSSDV